MNSLIYNNRSNQIFVRCIIIIIKINKWHIYTLSCDLQLYFIWCGIKLTLNLFLFCFFNQYAVFPQTLKTRLRNLRNLQRTSRRTTTRKLRATAATPVRSAKGGCSFPRHKLTNSSAGLGNRGICQPRRGSISPVWSAWLQPKWKSGSRTIDTKWREPGRRKVWKWPISLLLGGWPCLC